MKNRTSLLTAGGLGVALWAGVVSQGLLAQADPAPPTPPTVDHSAAQAENSPTTLSDAQRRSQLNKRLAAMMAEGRGGRLTDIAVLNSQGQRTRGQARPSRRTTPAAPQRLLSSHSRPQLNLSSALLKPSDPITCLTQTVYYEAGRESEEGRTAVAEVVMNRAASGRYPSDICDVVYQRNSRTCQFTFTCDGSIGRYKVDSTRWAQAERIARQVYSSEYRSILPNRSVNYHANYVNPTWSARLERVRRIGAHIFYGSALDDQATPGAEGVRAPQASGLLFVKNEAIERAYASMMGRDAGPKQ